MQTCRYRRTAFTSAFAWATGSSTTIIPMEWRRKTGPTASYPQAAPRYFCSQNLFRSSLGAVFGPRSSRSGSLVRDSVGDNMGTILDIIQKIRKRPVTMLGRPSASHLYAFLSGFAMARQGTEPSDYEFLSGFNRWVHERYEVTSTQDWGKIIEF